MSHGNDRWTYLLHIEREAGVVTHYMGSSSTRNFTKRMSDHRCGHAQCYTDHYRGAGATFIVANVWPVVSEAIERAISHSPVLVTLCPRCNPEAQANDMPVSLRPKKTVKP